MRHLKYFGLSLLLSLALPLSANAETVSETVQEDNIESTEGNDSEEIIQEGAESTENIDETGDDYDLAARPPIDEGTMGDLIPESTDGTYNGYATYEEYVNSRRQETLSEEQIKNGYQLINGIVYSPADLYGDTGDTHIGGVMPSAKTGYVKIQFTTPPGMHGNINAGFMSLDNFQTYTQVFYEIDDYTNSITLPDGTYTLDFATKIGDEEGKYFANHTNFEVIVGQNLSYTFDLLSSETDEKMTGYDPAYDGDTNLAESIGQIEESRIAEAKESIAEENTKKSKGNIQIIGWALTIILTFAPIVVLLYFYFKSRKHSRGYYD